MKPETINVLAETALGHLIFNIMIHPENREVMQPHLHPSPIKAPSVERVRRDVEVTMTINGCPVKIENGIREFWEAQCGREEEKAAKRALEMITEAGLEKLQNALRDADFAIRDALSKTTSVNVFDL